MIRLLTAMAVATLAGPAAADTLAVTNARIFTLARDGEVVSGSLVAVDGRIVAVGEKISVPPGARRIDAGGRIVTPGLIAVDTTLGVVELRGVPEADDGASRDADVGAAYDVQHAVDPASALVPEARLTGVTHAVVTPELAEAPGRRGPFAGLGAVIRLGGGEPVLRGAAVMAAELGEGVAGGRVLAILAIRAALADARAVARDPAAFDRVDRSPYGPSRADLGALVSVAEGRTPLLVRVHRAADIRRLLDVAKAEKIQLVLQGAEEGWLVAADIAAAGVPVVVDGQANLPTSFDTLAATLENAARLHAAGVRVVIQGARDFGMLRQARFNAGTAVANGLPYADALAALTINAARTFGVEHDIGSLAPGKEASFVIWDGDPLDVTSAPTAVYIRGVDQPLRSRGTELRDRYLAREPAYPRGSRPQQ